MFSTDTDNCSSLTQNQQYITNVFKERAHFSVDQLYALAEVLKLNEEETNYCELLLDHERAGHIGRRDKLRAKIETIRQAKLKSEEHIKKQVIETNSVEMARYYVSPELHIINFFLAIPRFSKQPHLIGECLNISPEQIEGFIQELIDLRFIQKNKNGIKPLHREFHLPKESPLCRPHLLLMHYKALQHQQLLKENEKYNFSVTFTADEKTRERIQREFLAFLTNIEELVKSAPREHVYQMHFDLFNWSS